MTLLSLQDGYKGGQTRLVQTQWSKLNQTRVAPVSASKQHLMCVCVTIFPWIFSDLSHNWRHDDIRLVVALIDCFNCRQRNRFHVIDRVDVSIFIFIFTWHFVLFHNTEVLWRFFCWLLFDEQCYFGVRSLWETNLNRAPSGHISTEKHDALNTMIDSLLELGVRVIQPSKATAWSKQ